MKDEDVLLSFLLSVCKNNEKFYDFILLFDHIYLQYCSPDKCREFISFVSEIAETNNMKTLISCIGKRFTQPNIPMKPDYMEGRHSEVKIDPDTITINKLKQEIERQKEIERCNIKPDFSRKNITNMTISVTFISKWP
jgi:hypothetical protein